MTADLVLNKKSNIEININNKSVYEILSLDEFNVLYQNALARIDNHLDKVAHLSADNSFGIYLWCLTYDVYRDDGLRHMLLHYYLIEQLLFLKDRFKINRVRILAPLPYFFSKIITEEVGVEVRIDYVKSQYLKNRIRYLVGPLTRTILKALKMTFRRSYNEDVIDPGCALFLGYTIRDNQRFRGFDKYVNKITPVYILDEELHTVKCFRNGKILNLRLFDFGDLFYVLLNTLKYLKYRKLFLKKHKSQISSFTYYIKYQSFSQTLNVFFRERAWERILKKLKPKNVIVMSTFGDPNKRLPLYVASKMGIKSILFAARPFLSNFRSEDRLINADKNKLHDAEIGNEIYVLDKFSKDYLIESGIMENRITIYSDQSNQDLKYINVFEFGILVLFADYYSNEQLIKLISSLPINLLKNITIFYRTHPSKKAALTNNQIYKLNSLECKTKNINEFEWSQMKFINVIAIASDSTSIYDAAKCGAGIVWLPFVTLDSIVLTPIINKIGYTSENEENFIKFMIDIFNNEAMLKSFCLTCNENYLQLL